eukprot:m.539542 g.539542  ORF g.539542 m.539542 type:complete len:268 (-) comp57635_c0_seq4:1042-1845(-)
MDSACPTPEVQAVVRSVTVVAAFPDGSKQSLHLQHVEGDIIGSGTFGHVAQVTIADTQEKVAVKIIKFDPNRLNMELMYLMDLDHPNLIKLRFHYFTRVSEATEDGDKTSHLHVHMAMDLFPDSVHTYIKRQRDRGLHVPVPVIRNVMHQVLMALDYLHEQNLAHRDVKPRNMLYDESSGHLQICDFGSMVELGDENSKYASYVCSRPYRAPELLCGSTRYTCAIGMLLQAVHLPFVLSLPAFRCNNLFFRSAFKFIRHVVRGRHPG